VSISNAGATSAMAYTGGINSGAVIAGWGCSVVIPTGSGLEVGVVDVNVNSAIVTLAGGLIGTCE
jgi:hypothetical protein